MAAFRVEVDGPMQTEKVARADGRSGLAVGVGERRAPNHTCVASGFRDTIPGNRAKSRSLE